MDLADIYATIRDIFPKAVIVSAVSLFCKENTKGSVYENVPFKNNPVKWFYNTDRIITELGKIPKSVIASHGLYHVDHSKLSFDAQEMSILGSCKYLNTNIFVPPFNKTNDDTVNICLDNGIEIYHKSQGWKNIEYENFDATHKYWYFHSWRWTKNSLRLALYKSKNESTIFNS